LGVSLAVALEHRWPLRHISNMFNPANQHQSTALAQRC
jgi:hypothetical protein